MMVEPSRLGALFQGDWEFYMKNFREVAYGHWALPAGERTILDWSGIDKLKLVENIIPIDSIEVLTNLFKFRWSVVGGKV
jgi:hypothetical protein